MAKVNKDMAIGAGAATALLTTGYAIGQIVKAEKIHNQ